MIGVGTIASHELYTIYRTDGQRLYVPLSMVTLIVCVCFWRTGLTQMSSQMCVWHDLVSQRIFFRVLNIVSAVVFFLNIPHITSFKCNAFGGEIFNVDFKALHHTHSLRVEILLIYVFYCCLPNTGRMDRADVCC